jgi:DNA-binding NtrC family response regulator
MIKHSILVVEDDDVVCFSLVTFLVESGYHVDTAFNGLEAWNIIKEKHYPVILCDINLPGMNGKEILHKLKEEGIESSLILFTGYGNIRDAVLCIKRGAFDYFVKPVDNDKLLVVIKRALEHRALRDENRGLKEKLASMKSLEIVYRSKRMEVLLQHARIAADTDATILVTSESGTGKTFFGQIRPCQLQAKITPVCRGVVWCSLREHIGIGTFWI